MFCKKCGNEIVEGDKFCVKCGTVVEVANQAPVNQTPVNQAPVNQTPVKQAPVNQTPVNQAPVNQTPVKQAPVNQTPVNQAPVKQTSFNQNNVNMATDYNGMQQKKEKKKVGKGPFLAGIGLIAAIVIVAIIILNRKTTVELNKYISVDFEGYDKVGTARVDFDSDQFIRDYRDKVKYTKAFRNSEDFRLEEAFGGTISKSDSIEYLYAYSVAFSLDKGNQLSNGDVVNLNWKCNDEAALEYFNCKLKYSDMEFKVDGLNKAALVDPFENIEINYTGIAPKGSVEAKYTGNISGLGFEVVDNGKFSNGDKAMIKVRYGYNMAEEDSLINEGIILTTLEKEVEVSGLDAFLTKIEEVSDSALEAMNKQCSDILKTTLPDGKNDIWEIESDEYYGSYLLTAKGDTMGNKNRLIVVHKVVLTFDYDGKKKGSGKISYLFPVEYSDLMVLADGTVSVDAMKGRRPQTRFKKEYDLGEWWDKYFYFYGYTDVKSMFNEYVTKYVDKYEYESTVDDSGFEAIDEFSGE